MEGDTPEQASRRAAGLCVTCGRVPPRFENGNECTDCLDRYEQEWLDEQRGFIRASAESICVACGKQYRAHSLDRSELSYNGEPFLRVLCNGTRVKL